MANITFIFVDTAAYLKVIEVIWCHTIWPNDNKIKLHFSFAVQAKLTSESHLEPGILTLTVGFFINLFLLHAGPLLHCVKHIF